MQIHRFQFRLRTLFVVVTLAAVTCAIVVRSLPKRDGFESPSHHSGGWHLIRLAE